MNGPEVGRKYGPLGRKWAGSKTAGHSVAPARAGAQIPGRNAVHWSAAPEGGGPAAIPGPPHTTNNPKTEGLSRSQ